MLSYFLLIFDLFDISRREGNSYSIVKNFSQFRGNCRRYRQLFLLCHDSDRLPVLHANPFPRFYHHIQSTTMTTTTSKRYISVHQEQNKSTGCCAEEEGTTVALCSRRARERENPALPVRQRSCPAVVLSKLINWIKVSACVNTAKTPTETARSEAEFCEKFAVRRSRTGRRLIFFSFFFFGKIASRILQLM